MLLAWFDTIRLFEAAFQSHSMETLGIASAIVVSWR